MSKTFAVQHVVDLAAFRNNVGCAHRGFDAADGFDGFGRTYPVEELARVAPPAGGWPGGWGRGAPDNVACDGQKVALGRLLAVRTLTLLGASCGGHLDDEILLEGDGPADTAAAPFGLPDFLARAGAAGEECEVATSVLREHGRDIQGYGPRMWRVEVHFDSPVLCSALRLPLNPGVHLFGARITVADGAVPERA